MTDIVQRPNIIGDPIGTDYGVVEYENKLWRKTKASWPTGNCYQYELLDKCDLNPNQSSVIHTQFELGQKVEVKT